MPGHAQYTLGPVTCIDNVVDNARVGYHQMASYFFKLTMETQCGKRKAEIGLPTLSQQQKRVRVHLFRDSYTAKWPYIVPSECDDYALIFVNFVTTVFPLRMAVGIIMSLSVTVMTRTHRGIEQTEDQFVC